MTREQIIAGLDCLSRYTCDGCPNYTDRNCPEVMTPEIAKAALELLKAQEPVEYVVHCKNADLSNGTEFACGECGGSLLHKKVNYCPWCGRAVKWDG